MADIVLTFTEKGAGSDVVSQERRQQAMLGRLALLHESRVQEAANRRSAAGPDSQETVEHFDRVFGQIRERVERGLVAARDKKEAGADGALLKDQLHKLMLEIGEMEQLLATSSFYLPAYDVRASHTTIGRLKDEAGLALSELVPRKKFSFRNKAASGKPAVAPEASPSASLAVPTLDPAEGFTQLTSVPGIRHLSHQVIVKESEELGQGEFMITDLSNCRVELRGTCRALFIHRLTDCQIFAGPVSGSVLIEEVERSVLMLASHQIRIHSTNDTDFYVRVRSRPVVEHTRGVRFAPYAFRYQGVEGQLEACNLSEETRLWENVDDFRWLRSTQSPNWAVLPESERLAIVEAVEDRQPEGAGL